MLTSSVYRTCSVVFLEELATQCQPDSPRTLFSFGFCVWSKCLLSQRLHKTGFLFIVGRISQFILGNRVWSLWRMQANRRTDLPSARWAGGIGSKALWMVSKLRPIIISGEIPPGMLGVGVVRYTNRSCWRASSDVPSPWDLSNARLNVPTNPSAWRLDWERYVGKNVCCWVVCSRLQNLSICKLLRPNSSSQSVPSRLISYMAA